MKLSELQTATETTLAKRNALYQQNDIVRQRGFAVQDWQAAITADTPVDDLLTAARETAALAATGKTLQAAIDLADNEYQRAVATLEYWQQRATDLAAELNDKAREAGRLDQELANTYARVTLITSRRQGIDSEIAGINQRRAAIVG